jgi:glycosyltransferase involved in cell wall biosynthesis
MKVLFTFPGLAHYLKAQLGKLQEMGVEVMAIVPFSKSNSMGAGVHIDQKGAKFKVIEGFEVKGPLGKTRFKNLEQVLIQEKPDILVIGWPYALDLVWNKKLNRTIQQLGVKLIYKGIPFNLPARNKIFEYYKSGQFAADETGTKTAFSWLGYFKFLGITLLRGIYLRKVDAHVYYIEEARDTIGSYGVPQEKIFITYNSPDTDQHLKCYHELLAQSPGKARLQQSLIHVGRLVSWKKVDLLISAFKILQSKYPNLELTIVGDGPELENLKKMAFGNSNIKFTGAIYDTKTLGQYLYDASIYVLAGMGGLSINEAMCYAKPILCSRADGTEKAMVREGINGYFFNNTEVDHLVERLDFMLADEVKLNKMGQESLRIIEEEINLHTVAARYMQAFQYVYPSASLKI